MRLNRFLAAAGIGSRRHCDELIAAGRVTINGKTCTDFSAQPGGRDHVKVNGKLVHVAPPLTIMLHKPAGFVSTRRDPHVRDTVFDLLPAKFSRLFNIGRLDAQTEGLLLLTSDGDLAQSLTHPRYKIEKEYEVTLDRPWDPELASKLLRGIFLDGERARIARLHSVSPVRLRVVLRQGINRQIRRMFEAVGYRVKDLIRVRIANLRLGDLPRGHWRPLTKRELESLRGELREPPRRRRAPPSTMKLDDCNALITGASAGIGREFARQLAGRARSMILVARRDERLIELADQLQREHPKLLVHIRKVDLADLGQLQAFLEQLDREKLEVDLLINNAGLGDSGPFAESDPDRNKEMTVVNVTTLTLVTRHLLPRMIAQHRGAILNVSSSAGFLPIPGSAVYAATKAYVTSFSEALRAELYGTGVSVCALCPGPVVTEFQQVAKREGVQPDMGPQFLVVTVEQVVRDALAALEADQPLVIPGFAMKLLMLLVRLMPMPLLRWVARMSPRKRGVV